MGTDDDGVRNGSVLPTHQVSAADRLQRFHEDDEALAALAVKTHERAMSDNENANAAGHLDLKIRERRAQMWGYDSPQKFDLVLMAEAQKPSDFAAAEAVVRRLIEQQPPAQRALRQRLQEMTAEEALEKLGPIEGDGPVGQSGPPLD